MTTYGSIDSSIQPVRLPKDSLVEEPVQKFSFSTYIFYAIGLSMAIVFIVASSFTKSSTIALETLYGDGGIESHYEMFQQFQETYRKSYKSNEEKQSRFEVFRQNLAIIDKLNEEASTKKKNTKYGLTHFADMTHEEWKELVLMDRSNLEAPIGLPGLIPFEIDNCLSCNLFPQFSEYDSTNLPENFDWRDYGAVTNVKNQAYCGSCWSFGASGDIEGSWYLAGNDLISLSEQQLVSCDSKYDFGCDGGWQEAAFENVINRGGIVSESFYPYLTVNMDNVKGTPFCDNNVISHENYVAQIKSWSYVSTSEEGEDLLALALVRQGPLTLALNAEPMSFYMGGIDNPENCDPQDLNHAVLLVGYGVENGVKYWTIKNSWSDSWGEDGYYRIVRGVNKCGIALDVLHSYV